MVEFKRDVSVYDNYCDGPAVAKIELSQEDIERILKLSKVVKKNKVHAIVDWDCTPEFFTYDDDGTLKEWTEGNVDCLMIHISENHINWGGNIKHTDITLSVDTIPIPKLKRVLKIMEMPKKDLPLLLGNDDSELNGLVEELLKDTRK